MAFSVMDVIYSHIDLVMALIELKKVTYLPNALTNNWKSMMKMTRKDLGFAKDVCSFFTGTFILIAV